MAGKGVTTRELVDRNVTAVDNRSTRQQFQPQTGRVATRDLSSAEELRKLLQSMLDQINSAVGELSTIPFLSGVFLANEPLTAGVDNVIRHGIFQSEVDIMATLPTPVIAGGSITIRLASQSAAQGTVTLQVNGDCTVSLLIFPKKRGI